MDDFKCPYCGKGQEACVDDRMPNVDYEHQCIECEKIFMYQIEYSPIYYERKADCMNGGDHDWREVVSSAKIAYDGVKRCQGCGELNKEPNWKGEFEALEK